MNPHFHSSRSSAGGYSGSPLSEGSRATVSCLLSRENWNGKYINSDGRVTRVGIDDANDTAQWQKLVDVSEAMCAQILAT